MVLHNVTPQDMGILRHSYMWYEYNLKLQEKKEGIRLSPITKAIHRQKNPKSNVTTHKTRHSYMWYVLL